MLDIEVNGIAARPIGEGYALGIDGTIWSYWKPGGPGDGDKFGRWTLRTDLSPRRLRPGTNGKGYLTYQLGRSGPRGYLHRLMWTTWRGAIGPGLHVRHRDGDKTNNRIENLLPGTVEENAADCAMHNTHPVGEQHSSAVLTESQVIEARRLYRAGMMLKDITSTLGVAASIGILSRAVTGGSWTHLDHIESPVRPGRQTRNRGEHATNSKLTDDLVIEARRLRRETDLTIQEIIDLLGLTVTVFGLNAALTGNTWKHLNHLSAPGRRMQPR